MDYIIFLVTLQLPFIYIFWRLFKRMEKRVNKGLQSFKKQMDQTGSLFETLRAVSDKNRETVLESFKNLEEENARLKLAAKRDRQISEERFRELERCTGISPSLSPLNPPPSAAEPAKEPLPANAASLKNKDFA